jgi:hypothetical protein
VLQFRWGTGFVVNIERKKRRGEVTERNNREREGRREIKGGKQQQPGYKYFCSRKTSRDMETHKSKAFLPQA